MDATRRDFLRAVSAIPVALALPAPAATAAVVDPGPTRDQVLEAEASLIAAHWALKAARGFLFLGLRVTADSRVLVTGACMGRKTMIFTDVASKLPMSRAEALRVKGLVEARIPREIYFDTECRFKTS